MHVARWIILSFLILAIVFTQNPLVSEEVNQFWVQVRPGLLAFMDGLYATLRGFVAGENSQDEIEENAPDGQYDFIITLDHDVFV